MLIDYSFIGSIIRNRHIALHMPGTSSAFPLVYYILFALFMIFAVVHTSYDSYFLSIIFTNRIYGHTINWIGQRALIVNDLFYAYSALFYSSSIVILSYVLIVRRQMKQLSFTDKVTTPSLTYLPTNDAHYDFLRSCAQWHSTSFRRIFYGPQKT